MQSRDFPILYAKAKTGATKVWSIRVDESHATGTVKIKIEHGKLNGKFVEAFETVTDGKNIGKINETTPFEQAVSQALSKWKKQMDRGYNIDLPQDEQVHNTNALGLVQPMLAISLDKIKKPLPDTIYIQPKLNGHRALVGYVDGKIKMWSRRGKWITSMDHILEGLDGALGINMVLDGELYIHGSELQDLGSLIKKKQLGSEKVEYHVYDLIKMGYSETMFPERLELLNRVTRNLFLDGIKSTVRVATHECKSNQIQAFFRNFVNQGFEGAMLRLPTQTYEPGFRSRGLLKVKEFADGEWKVKNIVRGIPKMVDGMEHDIAILDCGTFRVVAPGTVGEKDHVWRDRVNYIGKLITVQYAYLTNEGVPFHPVALQWREDV